jgi:hypothetical protein
MNSNTEIIINDILLIINNYEKNVAILKICKKQINGKYITKNIANSLYNKYNNHINSDFYD